MKYIELRKVETAIEVRDARDPNSPRLDEDGNPVYAYVSYQQWIGDLMRAPGDPRQGSDYEEQRKCIRVLDAVSQLKDGDTLALEDADHELLLARAKKAGFPFNDRAFIGFVDDIKDAFSEPPLTRLGILTRDAMRETRDGDILKPKADGVTPPLPGSPIGLGVESA